jgi:hypothetical protein
MPPLRITAGLGLVAAGALAYSLAGRAPARSTPSPSRTTVANVSRPAAGSLPVMAATARSGRPSSAASTPRVTEVLRAAWGSGPGELGRVLAKEGAPFGPMSFAVTATGRILVLDQTNQRVAIFEQGKPAGTIALPGDNFDDVALSGPIAVALLDRTGTGRIVLHQGKAGPLREVSLRDAGIAEPGTVTALFSRPDGLYVELDHAELRRVTDASGQLDTTGATAPGRFSADGRKSLRAKVVGASEVEIVATEPGGSRSTARIVFPGEILSVNALESDPAGRTFLAATVIEEDDAPPHALIRHEETLVVLDASLTETSRVQLPAKKGPEEQLRAYRTGEDGFLYHLALESTGAVMRRIEP